MRAEVASLPMRVAIEAMVWCDPVRGTVVSCELGDAIKAGITAGSTQVAKCSVGGTRTLIVTALPPCHLNPSERLALATLLVRDGQSLVAFLIEARTGYCRCETLANVPLPESRAIAMAAAVVQSSWAWDESARIVIDVDGCEFQVEPRYAEATWTAEVAASVQPWALPAGPPLGGRIPK
jgi:hypothetical protein